MNFGDRWDSHRALLRHGKHTLKDMQSDWDKYGEENFEFSILEEFKEKDQDKIDQAERYHIRFYKDQDLSYNRSDGGSRGPSGLHVPEHARRIIGEKNRQHMTGKKDSPETLLKKSIAQKARFEKMTDEERKAWGEKMREHTTGVKWTDEARKKFSERQATHPNSAKYTIDQVHEIRRLHEREGKGYTEISSIMNIPRPAVYLIATYRRWVNV